MQLFYFRVNNQGAYFFKIDSISSISLFRSFSSEDLLDYFSLFRYDIKKYEKNQIIHLQNEICRAMDIILQGRVAVRKIDEEGNVLTIDVFPSPEILGANLLFGTRNTYPMTIVAETDAVVLHLSRELVLELGHNNQDFMVELLGNISDRRVLLADKINSISYKTIRQQIIDFLFYEYHIQKKRVIELKLSKKELAERFGVQRPSLSRELKKCGTKGCLNLTPEQ